MFLTDFFGTLLGRGVVGKGGGGMSSTFTCLFNPEHGSTLRRVVPVDPPWGGGGGSTYLIFTLGRPIGCPILLGSQDKSSITWNFWISGVCSFVISGQGGSLPIYGSPSPPFPPLITWGRVSTRSGRLSIKSLSNLIAKIFVSAIFLPSFRAR